MVIIKNIQTTIAKIVSIILKVIMGLMVIMVVAQVFARYVLNSPNQYVEEILRFSLIWSVMLGSVGCFIKNEHIALTLLLDNISLSFKKRLMFIINLIIIFFVCLVMLYGGIKMSIVALTQLTPLLQIPMGVVYSIVPITGFLIAFVKILNCIELIFTNS